MMKYGLRFLTLYRRQESRPSQEKEMQKAKWLPEEDLQIAEKRKEKEKEKRKGMIHPFEFRIPKNNKER